MPYACDVGKPVIFERSSLHHPICTYPAKMDHDADIDGHISAYVRDETDDVNAHIDKHIENNGGKRQRFNAGDRSRVSAFQVPSKVFGSTSGARGVPTVKSVLSGFSEFYLDGIPAIAERGIEDLY